MDIKIGQNWEVASEYFMAYPRLNKRRAELIQIRTKFQILYPEEWHFRTEDGRIFFAKPHDILRYCECISGNEIDISKILNAPKRKIKGAHKNIQYKNAIKN